MDPLDGNDRVPLQGVGVIEGRFRLVVMIISALRPQEKGAKSSQ